MMLKIFFAFLLLMFWNIQTFVLCTCTSHLCDCDSKDQIDYKFKLSIGQFNREYCNRTIDVPDLLTYIHLHHKTDSSVLEIAGCGADRHEETAGVDLKVEAIGDWMDAGCSVTCGGGNQTQIKQIRVDNHNGTLYQVTNKRCNEEPCRVYKWGHLKDKNISRKEMEIEMKEELSALKANLKIDKKNTTSAVRRHISAPDHRKSSSYMGYVGVTVIIAVVLIIVFFDLATCYRHGRVVKRSDTRKKANKVHPVTE